jgi:hypothetical protein
MHHYQPLSSGDAAARRHQLWTPILDCRHAAGLTVMADDHREQVRAEAALAMAFDEAGGGRGLASSLRSLRYRVGEALMGLGERVRGATDGDALASSGPVAALPGGHL